MQYLEGYVRARATLAELERSEMAPDPDRKRRSRLALRRWVAHRPTEPVSQTKWLNVGTPDVSGVASKR